MAASDVLHQRVPADDHACGVVAFESKHRSESSFEPTVVGFDSIVRVLLGVVKDAGHQSLDRSCQGGCTVGDDLDGGAMRDERRREEPTRGTEVPPFRDVDVDDLAALIDRPIHVTPPAGDLHAGLIHEPTVPDRMAARPSRVDKQRSEALHPPVQGDVIDLDPTLPQELLNVAIRQPESQIPTDREDNDLRRDRKPLNAELGAEVTGRQARRIIPPP